ncbi:carbohydrate kinase FGGY [Listeria cornellensis FSL F6-0969]|uniref:Carbohydrate kinase FGGY n=2 Tax=Listeria cornellensis TaxID=1494961 RepID=W7BZB8_9LIST|nr:carbohydrate kinase FGGY [Listeria cornellensis FSL F6-0969]
MFLWSDNRAANTILEFKRNRQRTFLFYGKTGTPIHGMSPFAKLLYFKEKHNSWFNNVSGWHDMKSFLMSYFVNEFVTDFSIASATGLFNSIDFKWDEEILSFLQLSPSKLPRLVHPKTVFNMSEKVVLELNLKRNTKIMIGASDGCLASLASSQQNSATESLTLGTSGSIRQLSTGRYLGPDMESFCYYVDKDQWVVGGPTNNGGIVLEWLSDLFYEDKAKIFDHLHKAPDLFFSPYIQGERAPIWNEKQTGSFKGLNITHGRPEIIQSVLEGIIFNLKYILSLLSATYDENPLVLNGGAVKNKDIAQMISSVFNRECLFSSRTEPTQALFYWWKNGKKVETESTLIDFYVPIESEQDYYNEKFRKFVEMLNNEMHLEKLNL